MRRQCITCEQPGQYWHGDFLRCAECCAAWEQGSAAALDCPHHSKEHYSVDGCDRCTPRRTRTIAGVNVPPLREGRRGRVW